MNRLKVWLLAFRPKTLAAAIAPVMIGTVMAFSDGVHNWPAAMLALIGALTIQIGTNLANDYFDFKKGADTSERIGPTRVTQAGLIQPAVVVAAFLVMFGIAVVCSMYLYIRGGTPVAVIAVLSIVSGILYTAGPKPLGYIGLGELFVLVFFGPVAVAGTYYVQSLEFSIPATVAGLGPGFLAVAILSVNNLRDIDTDRKSGKRTLAVRFGRSFATNEYLISIVMAALTPLAVYLITHEHPWMLLSVTVIFLAVPQIRTVFTKTDGPSLNAVLGQTGKLLLIYSILFSGGTLAWFLPYLFKSLR